MRHFQNFGKLFSSSLTQSVSRDSKVCFSFFFSFLASVLVCSKKNLSRCQTVFHSLLQAKKKTESVIAATLCLFSLRHPNQPERALLYFLPPYFSVTPALFRVSDFVSFSLVKSLSVFEGKKALLTKERKKASFCSGHRRRRGTSLYIVPFSMVFPQCSLASSIFPSSPPLLAL